MAMPRSDRPKRKAIPVRVKRAVVERQSHLCACGCCYSVSENPNADTQFDHEPCLALREVAPDGKDYIPAQLDPAHIFAKRTACHRAKTSHPRGPHTSIDSDQHAIAKVRRLRGENKPKTNRTWPTRKLSSAPFSKKARPMQKRKKR